MDKPLVAREVDSLNERYTTTDGWVYMTGIQALVRLPIQQRLRDAAAGLNTGGYISGYRGSPLGRYDMELWAADSILKSQNVIFRSGLNEDLAATAIWGAQYVGLYPGATVDGVFGIWYGKGPGVDRCGDAFKHANLSGSSPLGGALILAGDDHGAKSSSVANFSDIALISAGIPILFPSNAQELLDFGLHGIALSRYSGCWTAMKVVTDIVEGGGSVHVSPDSPVIASPEDPAGPAGGVHIRAFDHAMAQEDRLYHHKLQRVIAYAQANQLNTIGGATTARVGIVSSGKAWQDVRQAFIALGIDEAALEEIGIRTLKVGLVWPLEPKIVEEFAQGLETIIVIEEKRPIIEDQIRALLYGKDKAPTIIGKYDSGSVFAENRGKLVFPNAGEISPAMVATVITSALNPNAECAVEFAKSLSRKGDSVSRLPSFCSGCPHGRSTKLPEGSRALAGIGCHTMGMFQDPHKTTTVSQMGGEGIMWLGQQPFTTEKHVFANLGDGTYFHSGFLAIRQAVSAHVPITYKILHNGFVSMTGGQPIDGELSIPNIITELAAEGVKKIALVSDEPNKWNDAELPAGVNVYHRSALDAIQEEYKHYPDVSVILYDQPCATERRRLRKRGKWSDPDKRVFINSAVCEGCGDCSSVTKCMSIEPFDTEFGRKRKINQSSCNKDFSCAEGFCPSFVTVTGGKLKKSKVAVTADKNTKHELFANLPMPTFEAPTQSFSVMITGIGGTGVVTIGQTLAVAAHLEGLFSSNLDVTGLAQKYGAVMSHVKFAPTADLLRATRIADGECDTLIGCDLIVTAGAEAMNKLKATSDGVICTDLVPTVEFSNDPNWNPSAEKLVQQVSAKINVLKFEALKLSAALLGDSITANMFLLGAAWQKGTVPLSYASIDRAIELNGVAIEQNREAFLWGRLAAHDLSAVEKYAGVTKANEHVIKFMPKAAESLDKMISTRFDYLTAYQDLKYANRYEEVMNKVITFDEATGISGKKLSKAVAKGLFKLMAHKDEWEVARLYSRPEFIEDLQKTFEGDFKLSFHVAGGPFGKHDPVTGKLVKREVGPWLLNAFKLMAPLRGLRNSILDPFRYSGERKLAKRLLAEYESDIQAICSMTVNEQTYENAVRLASLPDKIRGYGHVREEHANRVADERVELVSKL